METAKSFIAKKQNKGTVINLEQGKIPPQALDLEEAVLGAMMIDKKGVDDVIDILHDEVFYKPAHKIYMKQYSNFLKILNQLTF